MCLARSGGHGDGLAVFDGGAAANGGGKFDRRAGRQLDDLSLVLAEPGNSAGQGLELFGKLVGIVIIGVDIDFAGGIDGEEDKPRLGGALDIGWGLEVVGIGALNAGITGLCWRRLGRLPSPAAACDWCGSFHGWIAGRRWAGFRTRCVSARRHDRAWPIQGDRQNRSSVWFPRWWDDFHVT